MPVVHRFSPSIPIISPWSSSTRRSGRQSVPSNSTRKSGSARTSLIGTTAKTTGETRQQNDNQDLRIVRLQVVSDQWSTILSLAVPPVLSFVHIFLRLGTRCSIRSIARDTRSSGLTQRRPGLGVSGCGTKGEKVSEWSGSGITGCRENNAQGLRAHVLRPVSRKLRLMHWSLAHMQSSGPLPCTKMREYLIHDPLGPDPRAPSL